MSKRTVVSVLLALALPGAGHFYLQRRKRALIFFVTVVTMFVMGLLLEGRLYTHEPGRPLTLLATLGSMGAGLPYLIARFAGPSGSFLSVTYEYGTAFMLTAGLMNLLLVLDSFDISEERKA